MRQIARCLTALVLTLGMATGLCACGGNQTETADAPTWQEQYDLGIRYLADGNYEEAIIAFMAAIEIDPKQPDAYLKAAEAYGAIGSIEDAVAILEKGLSYVEDSQLKNYLEQLLGEESETIESERAQEPGAFPDPQTFAFVGAVQSTRIDRGYGEYGIQEIDEAGNMKRVWYFADGSMDTASLRFADSDVLYHFDSNWEPLRYSVSEVDAEGNQVKAYSYNAEGGLEGWTEYIRSEDGSMIRIDEYSADGVLINSQTQGD